MVFSAGDDLSDHDSLPDDQYECLLARYKELVENNETNMCSKNETEYMPIESNRVVLNDPEGCDYDEPQVKFPYLRRGAGLARFNMTPDQLKQGPPDFYKNHRFKSFQKCSKRTTQPRTRSEPVKAKTFPERKFATTAGKTFDDEIIPTLRNKPPPSDAFEIPIPKNLLVRRNFEPKMPDLPKTPLKKLVLKQGMSNLPRNEKENISGPPNNDSDSSDDEEPERSAIRRLSYSSHDDELLHKDVEKTDSSQRVMTHQHVEIIERVVGKQLKESEPQQEVRVFNQRQIAEAMKRKGLTDNVKKHLGWNTTPKKRRPVTIVKKIKVKKPKPVKEKLNLHELKDRLRLLEEVKNKLQAENNRMKRSAKDLTDEKVRLDKQRREFENMLKEERERIADERLKLMEDVKKFKRDKVAFEKFCAETKNLPTREEREEIRGLKEELEKLKELQRTKDARLSALQAQLRNRIAVLEKENSGLKEDLEIAKKVSLKKVRFESENKIRGKMIDAINTQLETKLKDLTMHNPKSIRRTKSASDVKPVSNKEINLADEDEPVEVPQAKDEDDSGIGSRPSSSGSSSGSALYRQAEEIEAIKKRLEKVLKESQEKVSTEQTEPVMETRKQNVFTSFHELDKRKTLDVTEDFSPVKNRNTFRPSVCIRHGVPAQEAARIQLNADNRFLDRDVIRTELDGGDIEEEELRTGVRRLWCGICGTCEVTYRNRIGYRRTTTPEGNTLEEHPDGMRECRYRSGEIVRKYANGDKEVLFPNGDREFTTRGFTKLERPDGIIKTVFDDGRQETRYPSGRIRLKDRSGHLIMDTGGFS